MQRRIVPDIMAEGRELLELPATASVYAAACAMRDWSVGAVLITDDGRLAGIFTERDMIDRVVACEREPRRPRRIWPVSWTAPSFGRQACLRRSCARLRPRRNPRSRNAGRT